ncbi:leucine--tRNA ligase [Ruminococcus sp. AF17-6LB]|uniref:leucine--tRNA ligase n=1 Tax=unclassified Ruminococcus TaxID=2608920 RepID=UPI000E53B29F|nr:MULTISPECIES: leucine--tRNA ligase [unclassified Ruminococcus]RGG70790.1 leucine--tRNA ligase [Ruminococcus sp. AF17-6LB]RGG72244.1 leucine--tRNA ligase [Ruminococcus sp. AF17-6]RGG72705.1 leucine--tRNA ligase [Ruminococcus sp. AF17-24]RGG80021.1 leucine--tRNA ligase [Ruminococcus sp. AF17-1AC]
MKEYNFSAIESKWQKYWDEHKTFEASNDFSKKKFYGLVEFPYPSGHGMHVGHIKAYSGLEVVSRKRRMQGYNVLFPIGFDAYGLPTENTAIKTGVHPRKVTDDNIKKFTGQLKRVGFSFDWSRVIDTTDENYYKWTQWIFLKMFENGLVFRDKTLVNYCPSCKVVLSNEDSQGGHCDVCHSEIVQKTKEVWYLRITEYADKLLQGLEEVDYLPNIKLQQQNWIGKSTGAFVNFKIKEQDEQLKIYTTRPDTLYGVTFMVIAPEHPIIQKYRNSIANIADLDAYKAECAKKSEFERTQLVKDKTGVKIDGLTAINPITGKEIPIYISDYVMMGYGTGAIMAVPAHDTRDYDFAKKFGIDIIEVIKGGDISKEAYTGDGEMVNSGELNGITNKKEAIEKMLTVLEKLGCGEKGVQYKMKDWAFNRQRYWGEPIPIVHCPHCGMVAVPYDELPLKLPPVENFEPGTDGESPLAKIDSFVHCKCPKCGCDAKRETDTMPQWAGSSWYFLRYCDPNNNDEFASQEALKYWMPVDWYNGGMEHVTRHMIYSRFWHKFLYDLGLVPTSEPYAKRTAQGLILGPDGEKMSKSRGNVVDPNDVVDEYGADVLRLYVLFMGDYEKAAPWSESSVKGCKRFVDRIWALQDKVVDSDEYSDKLRTLMHKTIKKVSDDIESMKFNTAIAAMMTLLNEIYNVGSITKKEFRDLLIILNPFAPHVTEELYQMIGCEGVLDEQEWVTYDEALCKDDTIEIVCQINGKVKSKLTIPTDAARDDVIALAKADEAIVKATEGKNIVKEIYVPNKLVNLVVK